MLEEVIGSTSSPCVARVNIGDADLWVYADTPDALADRLSGDDARQAMRKLKGN